VISAPDGHFSLSFQRMPTPTDIHSSVGGKHALHQLQALRAGTRLKSFLCSAGRNCFP
jgi:hypothetical protein